LLTVPQKTPKTGRKKIPVIPVGVPTLRGKMDRKKNPVISVLCRGVCMAGWLAWESAENQAEKKSGTLP